MRYELADYEWAAIKPMLPNNPTTSILPMNGREWCEADQSSLVVEAERISRLSLRSSS